MSDCIKKIEQVIPLSVELLRNYNFFELYPYDGGGGHIHHQIVGTLNDTEITDKIVNQNILSDWGDPADAVIIMLAKMPRLTGLTANRFLLTAAAAVMTTVLLRTGINARKPIVAY